MNAPIRWGILGCGRIAGQFAEGLKVLDDAELVAVGSRSQENADAFADRFGAPRRHGSYEDLARDPEVDVVYVATPHSLHAENTLLCLREGKAVLCEKPFAINALQAESMIQTARQEGLFLMEAMWTRFLPAIVQVRRWLQEGAIGEPRLVTADFGFRAGVNAKSRLFDPALGGGALLDVGIYTVSFASLVFGPDPVRIESMAHLGKTGVDEQAAILLGYEDDGMALLATAIRATTPQEARIVGTEGRIQIDSPFWKAERAVLQAGDREEEAALPLEGNGYNYEAAEVGRCLREGKLESSTMPLDESLKIMRILDRIRAQWGLRYPME